MDTRKLFEDVGFARAQIVDLLARVVELGQHPDTLALGAALDNFRRLAEALQAHFGLLRDTFDRTSDLVFAKDVDGRYALLNPRAADVFGRGAESVLGQDDRALFSPEDARRIMAVDARVRQSGAAVVHEEDCATPQGRVHLMVTTTVWHGQAREVRGVIGIAQDLREQRPGGRTRGRTVESLRAFAAEVTLRAERLRRSWAADLHSGLGQDIALAKLQLAMLRERAGVEVHEALRRIEGLVHRADRSLHWMSIETSSSSLHELGLMPALAMMAEDIRRKYGLVVALEDRGAPAVDDERMATIVFHAVRELLVNVARHSGVSDAKVEVDGCGDFVRVVVTDAGRGFDALDAELRGLGLFGIDEQLRVLQGNLSVESSPAGGARITLTAPVAVERTTTA
jgi:PAS domain S-box-containing protein